MEAELEGGSRQRRGRVVMLVDNDVRGDSRVQKTARSAAAAGWDVILIGELRESPLETWRIGDAEVRLVRVRDKLVVSPYERRGWYRPFAYPPGWVAGYQYRLAAGRRADIRARYTKLAVARREGGSQLAHLWGKARVFPRRALVAVFSRWVRFRVRQSRKLRDSRRAGGGFFLNFPVKFWRAMMGPRCWRRLDPSLWEWELAFGSVIDELQPDIIHAHDFRMVGVGARAKLRARAAGRDVKLVYDAHEYVPGLRPRPAQPGWLAALCAYEKEFIGAADAVVTVSSALAELLQKEHDLPEVPNVVMNAPVAAPGGDEESTPVGDIRAMCGVDHDTPLLAYCGGITQVRGVDLMIEALPQLPDVHLVFVSMHPNGKNAPCEKAQRQADELGVGDRVHLLPYVPHWQVSAFLAPADAAVSPLLHLPNHEIALSNKFFEYSRARLPLIVSDVRTMAEMVRSTGQGEVFRAGDLADYVRAVRAVLDNPAKYRAAYDDPELLRTWTWEAQAEVLDQVYTRLLPQSTARLPVGVAVGVQ